MVYASVLKFLEQSSLVCINITIIFAFFNYRHSLTKVSSELQCICLTRYTYVPGLFSRSTQVSQVTNFCLWATEQLSFLNKLKCWAPRILWLGTFGHLFNFLRLESWYTVNIPRTVYTTKWKIYCKEKNNLGLPWSSHTKSKQVHFQLVFNLDWYKKYFGDKTYLHKNSWSLRWWKRNIKHQNCYIPAVRG